jgi:hypothetical protein
MIGRMAKRASSRAKAPASSPRKPAKSTRSAPRDVALIIDQTDDEEGFRVLRRRGDEPVELGTIRPLKEGAPIEGEVVSLKPRKDVPFIYDVKTKLADNRRRFTSDGPPQVATKEYRSGWEAIWGKRGYRGKPN